MKKTTSASVIRYINDTTAQVTKAFEKKACIFGTEEFKLWREYKKEFPDAVMTTKDIKKNPNKRVNTKNMTYPNMELFIKQQKNAEVLLAEFEKQKALSKVQNDPYRFVLAWFMKKFENYDEDYKAFLEAQAKKNEKKQNLSVATSTATDAADETQEEDCE